jgi:hypothetical protein
MVSPDVERLFDDSYVCTEVDLLTSVTRKTAALIDHFGEKLPYPQQKIHVRITIMSDNIARPGEKKWKDILEPELYEKLKQNGQLIIATISYRFNQKNKQVNFSKYVSYSDNFNVSHILHKYVHDKFTYELLHQG